MMPRTSADTIDTALIEMEKPSDWYPGLRAVQTLYEPLDQHAGVGTILSRYSRHLRALLAKSIKEHFRILIAWWYHYCSLPCHEAAREALQTYVA